MANDLEQKQSDQGDLPEIDVWVNAGFGGGSHRCTIKADSTMTLPDALVQEMRMKSGDELEWKLDEETVTLYVKVISKTWEYPDWLQE